MRRGKACRKGLAIISRASIAGAAALAALVAGAAAAERLPSHFATQPVGSATLYDTDRGRRLYLYAAKTEAGHVERVYAGCPKDGDPEKLGAPLSTHYYDPGGEILRSEWRGGFSAAYSPHGCAITLGRCEGEVRYRGWLADKSAVETFRFEHDMTREGERFVTLYVERDLDDGAEEARIKGAFDVTEDGAYDAGSSTETRRGAGAVKRWFKFLSGPAPVARLCGGAA